MSAPIPAAEADKKQAFRDQITLGTIYPKEGRVYAKTEQAKQFLVESGVQAVKSPFANEQGIFEVNTTDLQKVFGDVIPETWGLLAESRRMPKRPTWAQGGIV